jgi:trehalose 6-phosphate phosphatase
MSDPAALPQGLGWRCRKARREGWLLVFDFDGTLAPIAARPEGVRIDEDSAVILARLAAMQPTAVVSGRALADLVQRIPAGVIAVGNHGAEWSDGDGDLLAEARQQVAAWHTELDASFAGPDRWVEDKGLSLTLHWRGSPDPDGSAADAVAAVCRLVPDPQVMPGHCALNCLPPGLPDKGVAVRNLLARTGRPHALFVGDDWTDASVFTLGDPRIDTVQVGTMPLGARWILPDQAAVRHLLTTLAEESP